MDDLSFIHRFVPAVDVAHARTLLLLHGTGGDEDDLLPLGKRLSTSANLLSPRGKVEENGMLRFFRRFAEGIFDVEDLKVRTRELAHFIGEAATHYGFDPHAVTAVGFSNGANIAASLLLLRPEVLAAAVLLRGTLPLTPETLPNLSDKPVLILAGEQDSMIPREGTEALGQALRAAGASVTLSWQPGGHSLTDTDIDEATAFLEHR